MAQPIYTKTDITSPVGGVVHNDQLEQNFEDIEEALGGLTTPEYTGELSNTNGIFKSGQPGFFVTNDGVLKTQIQKGNTFINLVDGEAIVVLGTVSWLSVLDDIYYDSLNDTNITGTGVLMTATNNSGVTANMNIINKTAQDITLTDVEMYNNTRSYITKIQSTESKKVTARGENKFDKNVGNKEGYYNGSDIFVPSTVDWSTDYIKVLPSTSYFQNDGTSQIANFYSNEKKILATAITSGGEFTAPSFCACIYVRLSYRSAQIDTYSICETPASGVYEPYDISFNYIGNLKRINSTIFDIIQNGLKTENTKEAPIATATNINTTNFPLAKSGGAYILIQDDFKLLSGLVNGSDTTTDTGTILYELDTPVISNTGNTNLNCKSLGDTVIENKFYKRSFQYSSSGIDLTGTGYTSQVITEANVVDFENSDDIMLDVSNFVESPTNVFTNSELVEGDWISIEVEWLGPVIYPTTEFDYTMNQGATIASNVATIDKLSLDNKKQNNDIKSLQEKKSIFGDEDSGNYAEFNEKGELRLRGDATQWDDQRFPVAGFNLDANAGRVDINVFNGGLDFATNARYPNEPVSMLLQLSHARLSGSDLEFHLHWLQTSINEPNWLIAYKVIKNNTATAKETDFSNHTLLTKSSNVFTYTSGNLVQITDFGTVDGSTLGISDLVHIVLFRDSANTSTLFAGTDPDPTIAFSWEFDVHIQKDSIGSNEEYVKY